MDMTKVRVVETVYTQEQKRVESLGEGLSVTASVTEQNGTVTGIDSIEVREAEASSEDAGADPMTAGAGGGLLWTGYASPNISGSFHSQGREIEVLTAVMEFIEAVRG